MIVPAIVILPDTYTSGSPVSYLWSGDGSSGFYLWGAQVVPYTGVLTDYQPTTTTSLYGWSRLNVSLAKNQTGIDGVANAATSITATASGAVLIQPAVLASGSRTCSVYLKRLVGTGTVQLSLDGATWSSVDITTTEWRRVVLSGTVTNPTIGIKLLTSGDAVAMDFAQVEDGTFATMPILTTSATATRSLDVATVGGSNFRNWCTLESQTLCIDYKYFAGAGGGPPFSMWAGSSTSQIQMYANVFNVSTSGSSYVNFSIANNSTPLYDYRMVYTATRRDNSIKVKLNNSTSIVRSWIPGISENTATLYIGGTGAAVAMNGYAKRFIFYPNFFNDFVLSTLGT